MRINQMSSPLRILMLAAFISAAGVLPATAKGTLPPGVQQTMMLFALQAQNRHIDLLINTVGTEHPEVKALGRSPDLTKRLGLRRAKTFNKNRSLLLLRGGRFYTISKARANKLLGQFIDFFSRHPKFEVMFDRYISRLQVSERLAVKVMLIAKSKPKLFRHDARQFMLDTFQTISNDNLKRSGT